MFNLKQKISDHVSLVVIGLASVAAATAAMAAAVNTQVEVTSYTETAMTAREQVSRRTLLKSAAGQQKPATRLEQTSDCKTAPPTVCAIGAICVKSGLNGQGGVAKWVCKTEPKRYGN